MLVYDHDRTDDIVGRLVKIGSITRIVTITSFTIIMGAIFSLVMYVIVGDTWWLGGLVGLLVGYVLGTYTASLFLVVLEWMAQLLVSQGEIIARSKK
jgi:hypothetical protein